jgi:hypothetical protein
VRVGAAIRYIEAYERITGSAFAANSEEPRRRIANNVLGLGSVE